MLKQRCRDHVVQKGSFVKLGKMGETNVTLTVAVCALTDEARFHAKGLEQGVSQYSSPSYRTQLVVSFK